MMHRVDYKAIAKAIHKARQMRSATVEDTCRMIQRDIATYCEQDNPQFNRRRFNLACEEGFPG